MASQFQIVVLIVFYTAFDAAAFKGIFAVFVSLNRSKYATTNGTIKKSGLLLAEIELFST